MTEEQILALPTKSRRDVLMDLEDPDSKDKHWKKERDEKVILSCAGWEEYWQVYTYLPTDEMFRVYMTSFRSFSHSRARAAN